MDLRKSILTVDLPICQNGRTTGHTLLSAISRPIPSNITVTLYGFFE